MTNRTKAILALFIASFIWGISSPIIKKSFDYITAVEFLFLRFFIVSLCILPFFIKKLKKQPFEKKDWPALLITALAGTSLNLGLLFWGLEKTTSLDSAVISATSPVLIVIAGAFFLKEHVSKQEVIGLFFALFGTLLAVVAPVLNGGEAFSSGSGAGNLLIFAGSIVWVIYAIVGKKLCAKYPSFNITALSFVVGFISFIPLYYFQRVDIIGQQRLLGLTPEPFFYFHPQALLGILFMSVFGSLIAYFAYTYGMSLIEASEATLFTYLQPLFTAPLSFFWLHEKVSPFFLLGSIIIVIGVILTEYKGKKVSFTSEVKD